MRRGTSAHVKLSTNITVFFVMRYPITVSGPPVTFLIAVIIIIILIEQLPFTTACSANLF